MKNNYTAIADDGTKFVLLPDLYYEEGELLDGRRYKVLTKIAVTTVGGLPVTKAEGRDEFEVIDAMRGVVYRVRCKELVDDQEAALAAKGT